MGRAKLWCSAACYQEWWRNHGWTYAKRAMLQKASRGAPPGFYKCAGAPGCRTRSPEVNHKLPCLGKHDVTGCHHHKENLEVLCHEHHLEATRAQRAAGLLKRRPPASAGREHL